MEAFDHLPIQLRAMLRALVQPADPGPLLLAWYQLTGIVPDHAAIKHIVGIAEEQERVGIRNTARRFEREHGLPYPHLAAEVSVLRPVQQLY